MDSLFVYLFTTLYFLHQLTVECYMHQLVIHVERTKILPKAEFIRVTDVNVGIICNIHVQHSI